MSLGSSIVVVNEFTVKNQSGRGSRGSTPGDYVMNYMSRDKASETLTPVKLTEQSDYIERYMAREEATETMQDRDEVKPEFKNIQKYGGVAFGYGDVSLSDEKLRAASKDIQANFDDGKTVMKTVLSFDEEYLRENKIIEPDFVCKNRGDFRGNIDQMKLRMAIMNGMNNLSRDYDDLQYVGTIQVDTMHVHCHLAMVDRGVGVLASDGTQKGKLSIAQMDKLRRGVDTYLDETKNIQHMCSNINMDKRNTSIFIKQVSHKTMQENGMSQLLIACLPEDKRLWRASTNAKSMQKANALTREYVRELFNQPESGYDKVKRDIYKYAEARRDRESLSGEEFRKLIKNGETRVEDECINNVYGMMQNIEKRDKDTHTPMLDLMSMPLRDVSKDADELGEFTYKLRTYNTRLGYHKNERDKSHEVVTSYENALAQNQVSEDAKPVYDFFKFEEEYNEKLMCKYQHFLHFLPPDSKHRNELKELLDYKQSVTDVDGMLHDKTIKRMKESNAEDYAERVYNQRGGRYMTFAPDIIETRLRTMQKTLEQKDKDFAYKLTGDSLAVTVDDDGIPRLKRHIKHDFDDVKALDIHHLGYDSPSKMSVSQNNVDVFIKMAQHRAELAQAAYDYLELSGQEDELDSINMKDIRLMQRVANKLNKTHEVESLRYDTNVVQPKHTIDLSKRFDVSIPVKQSLMEIEMQDEDDMTYGRRRH